MTKLEKTMAKLTKTSRERISEFDEAAQHRGVQYESGYGNEVNRAQASYEEAALALAKRVAYLEGTITRLRGIVTCDY